MRRRDSGRAALAALLIAWTGCAGPTPTERSSLHPLEPTDPVQASHTGRSPAPSPVATSPGGLADEIEVGVLGSEATGDLLEFASTGASIVYSAGGADAAAGAAPDLWRLTPGPDAVPELAWRNPDRDHSIVRIDGDLDTVAFVEMPVDGERAWNLWVLPPDGEAVILDSHPGDETVSSLVPSFSIYEPAIVWTAFDRGPSGAVSQMLAASAPDWTPRVVAEIPSAEGELWLPSLYGDTVVYTEVRYADDRRSDERSVLLGSIGLAGEPPRRLDTSGLATMPQIVDDVVVWKEADRGFNMFNWGRMFRYELATGEVSTLDTWPQDHVNYPSAGSRFVAWWGSNSTTLGVYDLVLDRARLIERHAPDGRVSAVRPHLRGDLLVWMHADDTLPGRVRELRYAFLPGVRDLDR